MDTFIAVVVIAVVGVASYTLGKWDKEAKKQNYYSAPSRYKGRR